MHGGMLSKALVKANYVALVATQRYCFDMARSHTHEQPSCSAAAWDAAVDALRAGGSVPQIVKTLRLAEPERTRITSKLNALRRQLVIDPSLSLEAALSRLADIRRDELERPIVDAAESNANSIQQYINNSRPIYERRNVLANQLRDINRTINQIDRVGLGTYQRHKLVIHHDKTVSELLDLYERLATMVDNLESVYVRATAQADRGLALAGIPVKEIKHLGGTRRSDRHIYRSRDRLADPPSSEHRFTPTLRELMSNFQAAEAAIAEVRSSIETDRKALAREPGATDIYE